MMRRQQCLLLLLVSGTYLYAQFLGDGPRQMMMGTKHDLSSKRAGGTSACEYCHVPNSSPPDEPPLWNAREAPGLFAQYGTQPPDPIPANEQSTFLPAAFMSFRCMSCHDGSIASAGYYVVGSDSADHSSALLSNGATASASASSHPVDFVYGSELAKKEGGLRQPVEGASVRIPYIVPPEDASASKQPLMPLPLFKGQPGDTSGKIECATCHNPHNGSNSYFLRASNAKRGLCLLCHTSSKPQAQAWGASHASDPNVDCGECHSKERTNAK